MRTQAIMRLKNDHIVKARQRLGLTQKKLAEIAGISIVNVNELENLKTKRYKSSYSSVLKISCVLGIPPDEVLPPELAGKEIQTKFEQVKDIEVDALLLYGQQRIVEQVLPSPAEIVEQEDLTDYFMDILKKKLCFLTSGEKDVVTKMYGLDGKKPLTLTETAKSRKRLVATTRANKQRALYKLKEKIVADVGLKETKEY